MNKVLHAGTHLSLIREGHWEYAARAKATGAAIIVAVTDQRTVVLVEQYRIPVHARTVEFPAGLIGDETDQNDEAHADAARRELLEETGFAAEHMEVLTHGPASSGLGSELVTLFRATGLRRVGKGGGVDKEDITVHEVPLDGVDAWLESKAKAGVLVDPKTYAGLYFIRRNDGKGYSPN